MSSIIVGKSKEDAIAGFYYDQQLKNRAMTVTLHPNRKYDPGKPEKWSSFPAGDTFEGSADKVENQYKITPIATAILVEDLQIGVANEWMDSSIANDAVDMFNSLKPLAPYAGKVSDYFREGSKNGKPMEGTGQTSGSNKAMENANKGMNFLGDLGKVAEQYLNRALVVQGSRFSYYNGSGVAFGNMTLKFTVFSEYSNTGTPIDCRSKVEELTNYVIGKYVTFDNKDKYSEGQSKWNEFVGWQIPPGGFKADLTNIDNVQGGTLMAIIGGIYTIPNLVIQDAQYTFSKQLVKLPKPDGTIELYPMSCDIQLTLKPASKYTGDSFNKSIRGAGALVEFTQYKEGVLSRLNTIKNDYKGMLSKLSTK